MAKKTAATGKQSTSKQASKSVAKKPEGLSPKLVALMAADAASLAAAKPAVAVVRTGPKVPSPAQLKRLALRDAEFGADAAKRIWHKREAAFCTVPRALPLLCTLIRHLRSGADAERVYLDLWSRQHEDGFIEVYDEEEFAMACDYADGSGVRYWRKGMSELVRLGFIEVKAMNKRKFGYVLLVHPEDVVRRIYCDAKTQAPTWWLPMFQRLLIRQGAKPRAQHKPAATA